MALTSITYADGTHDEKDGRPCVEVEVQCTHLTPEEARALVACHRHRNRGGRGRRSGDRPDSGGRRPSLLVGGPEDRGSIEKTAELPMMAGMFPATTIKVKICIEVAEA